MPQVLPDHITTVLFDMAGVLIDSSVAVEMAYGEWARENGYRRDEVLEIVHGRRTIEVVQHFGFDEDPEGEADRLERLIAEKATTEHAIRPTCDLFRSLDSARLAVATSARRATALSNLRVLGLERPTVLVTGQDVRLGKPAPDPYLLAAGKLGVHPGECVVIEDAPAGIQAGLAAGAHVIALTTTHKADELKAADQVTEPERLRDIFRQLTA